MNQQFQFCIKSHYFFYLEKRVYDSADTITEINKIFFELSVCIPRICLHKFIILNIHTWNTHVINEILWKLLFLLFASEPKQSSQRIFDVIFIMYVSVMYFNKKKKRENKYKKMQQSVSETCLCEINKNRRWRWRRRLAECQQSNNIGLKFL